MSRPSKGKRPSQAPATPAAGHGTRPPLWSHPGVVCVALALLIWAVFGQTLRHDFINYDDPVYVYQNPVIVQGMSGQGVVWAFTHVHAGNWHPLTTLSHMLDCHWYGLRPGGHHFTNVLLHGATAIALFLVLLKMTGARWPSAFVAAVFAIHPLRVESVAWISERKDVLSGLCFVLTLGAYTRYVQRPGARPIASPAYWLALLCFTLGLLSKPMLVTLPFVLLLLDYWPLARRGGPTAGAGPKDLPPAYQWHLLEKLPFFALSLGACAATVMAQANAQAIASDQVFGLSTRIGNALVAYVAYVGQLLYPAELAIFYPHPGNRLSSGVAGAALLILLAISTGVILARNKYRYLPAGWFWYLGMLVPVIGFVQVGSQARADRYTYLPQIGLCVLIAWGAADLCASWRHRRGVLGALAAASLAGLTTAAYVQTTHWRNSITLWTHVIGCTTGNFIAHNSLGIALAGQGKGAEAMRQYELALQIKPDYAEVHYNFGVALARDGKPEEAVRHYEQALKIQPDYAHAHNNLGAILGKQGRLPEAMQHYEQALKLEPDYLDARYNLGSALAASRKPDEAIHQFRLALELAAAQKNSAVAEIVRKRLEALRPGSSHAPP